MPAIKKSRVPRLKQLRKKGWRKRYDAERARKKNLTDVQDSKVQRRKDLEENVLHKEHDGDNCNEEQDLKNFNGTFYFIKVEMSELEELQNMNAEQMNE